MPISGQLFQIDSPNDVKVDISNAGGLAVGQTYTLIDWETAQTNGVDASAFDLGSSPVAGTFEVVNDTLEFTVTAFVPEPPAWAGILGGMVLIGTVRLLRRQT